MKPVDDRKLQSLSEGLRKFYESNSTDMRYFLATLYRGELYLGGYPVGTVQIGARAPALIMGTGVPDFCDFVTRHGGIKYNENTKVHDLQSYLQFLLSFLSKAVSDQPIDGFGLDRRWGLGMELAVIKTSEQLTKIDRVLYQSYFCERIGAELGIEQRGERVFNYYDGEDLVIVRQSADGTPHRPTIVRPPDKPLLSQEKLEKRLRRLQPPPSSPHIICTTFVPKHGPQAKYRTPTVDINEAGHAGIGMSKRPDGTIAMSIHPDYVINLLERDRALRMESLGRSFVSEAVGE